jgi:tetratricopeptide (TPR) repeat protein
VEINEAIAKHTEPMAKMEVDFAVFARERAEQLAPGLDFAKPAFETARLAGGPSRRRNSSSNRPLRSSDSTNSHPAASEVEAGPEAWESWAKTRPTNFWIMTRKASQLAEHKDWPAAKVVLVQLLDLYPDFVGADSAYRQLAAVHRALGETNAEMQVLARFAEKDDEATDAYLKLMEHSAVSGEWPVVVRNAERYLAVNPMAPSPYRQLALASEQTGEKPAALGAYRSLLKLDPPDPADAHFHIAKLLHDAGDPAAKREVLQALEEAPRYQQALRLLLDIAGEAPGQVPGTPAH